ncbi:PAS domain S-box protein (plasmid) [Deinococcus sp. KNUC1210]|uniref:PAS domain S-box protein n=1 Tax=Deinococcus sp. KNUC1210 TaxID=2917691 RepID=UPI001EF0CD7B|nr:PAS domain S-box protein [Deinococcus sp. KNUC1210]ULH17071.1 PAS domain S-box protein [Deinococcus sp. KNUC1210]
MKDESGVPTHLVVFQQEVGAWQTAPGRVEQANQRLAATIDKLSDPVVSYDRDWTITYVNKAGATFFGHSINEMIGQSLNTVFPNASQSAVIQAARRTMETGVDERVTAFSPTLGQELEATTYATDEGVAVLLHDITAERQMQLELQASQDRFATAFKANPLAVIITRERDGQVLDVNPAFLHLTGYSRGEALAHTLTQLNLWEASLPDVNAAETLPDAGETVAFRLKSGELRQAVLSSVSVTLANEPCQISTVRDITEENRTQQRLAASEQAAQQTAADLQRTLDLSLDLVTSIDAEGRYTTMNAASLRLLGYPPEALIGRRYLEFIHPDDLELSLRMATQLRKAQTITVFQNRYLRQDGSVIWLDWTAVRRPDGMVYATARDVTERRAATEDLAFLAAIVRASTDAIIGLSLDGRVRAWNAGAEQMYGYPATEMIGHSITEIVPPELFDEEAQLLARAFKGEYTPAIETTRLSRAGIRIPVQLSIAPIFDLDGLVVGVSKIAQDISGRRETERQILQLNARLQRQLDHLSGLREIDLAITSSLDLNMTLGIVLDKVRAQVDADAVTLLLLDPYALTLSYAATRGFRTAVLHGPAVRLGEAVAGQVALSRQPVVHNELDGLTWGASWQALLAREQLRAYAAVPLVAKGKVLGVLEVLRQQPFEASLGWLETVQTLAGQAAIAVDSAQLFVELERSNLELGLAYQETIEGWARALDLRDKETEGHSRRVTDLTVQLCQRLQVSAGELVHIRRGALLHDIGKVGISDAILLKPGALTAAEWEEMRQHPRYAMELLGPIQFLRPALEIPQHHHEKWDGSGYPQGLRGTAIPLAARAFAVVDVYDALTNDRPYRAAWTQERALAYLEDQAGSHFDPLVVQAFLALHRDLAAPP